MKYRIFRIEDEAFNEKVRAFKEEEKKALEKMRELMAEFGAIEIKTYRLTGAIAGFVFETAQDNFLWRCVSSATWLPKKNTKAGKDLWKKIDALPRKEDIGSILKEYDIHTNSPALLDGCKGYAPYLTGYPIFGIWFVHMPWASEERIAEINKQDEEWPDSWSYEREYLKWTPPQFFKEIKEWEYLKEFEELGEKLKELELES